MISADRLHRPCRLSSLEGQITEPVQASHYIVTTSVGHFLQHSCTTQTPTKLNSFFYLACDMIPLANNANQFLVLALPINLTPINTTSSQCKIHKCCLSSIASHLSKSLFSFTWLLILFVSAFSTMADHQQQGNEAKGCGIFDFLKNKDEEKSQDATMVDVETKEEKSTFAEKLQSSHSNSSSVSS